MSPCLCPASGRGAEQREGTEPRGGLPPERGGAHRGAPSPVRRRLRPGPPPGHSLVAVVHERAGGGPRREPVELEEPGQAVVAVAAEEGGGGAEAGSEAEQRGRAHGGAGAAPGPGGAS